MLNRWSCLAAVPVLFALATSDAHALGAPAASASAAVTSAPTVLPELPRLASIALPEPDAASIKELDGLLDRLTSADERSRTNARTAVNEVSPGLVPAIRHRVQDLRGSLDREAAPRVLEAARKAGRKSIKGSKADAEGDAGSKKKKEKAKKDEDDAADGDWLDFLLAQPHASDRDWKDVVSLVAMERMLTAIGTTPAVRELVNLHSYFGEMLRVDLQRQVIKLRDKADGFQNPADARPVWRASSTKGAPGSNGAVNGSSISLYISGLAIDTGNGNSGAKGLEYHSNNIGRLEDVHIRSGDGAGTVGLDLTHKTNGPALITRVRVSGFDFGIASAWQEYSMTLEHIGTS